FAEIGAWRDYPHILDASHFAVVSRPGHSVKGLAERLPALAPRMTQRPAGDVGHTATWIFLIDATTADVSSSAIRRARAASESIALEGARPAHIEGYDRSEWILIDYFDFIVHVFAPETRMFYGLERLWGSAERIEFPEPR